MKPKRKHKTEASEIQENYPRAARFLEDTGMTLDEALMYTELELKKKGRS